MFSRSDTKHACHIDRQTDRQTGGIAVAYTGRASIASRR